ncbi:hypothetical protein [Leptospira santarosai]|uniref:Uncharacterized protein n=1 Tax=Leptospira santarosai TaxID=28183 RepID=A0AB73LSG5_9LEPT|nr:hypothetical protein [Leptospira santarosai]AVV51430.1 Uncharacterized protein XB17_02853 [Leptospira santarosai]AVV79200.1 Uncharacterized protein XB15_01422 [Leptospira santarosai]MDI7174826.1 hypothetical protein [Leptospira santarosai]MDI7193815.1 hypothetical protein [Leptospira santarosai]MDO6395573.1 hypothetical protein [Leptospira santarosai]
MDTNETILLPKNGIKRTNQIRIDILLGHYDWVEKQNDPRRFEHKYLENLEISVKSDDEIHFRVKENPYYLTTDKATVEQVLEYIDSNWKRIRDLPMETTHLDRVFANPEELLNVVA